jgi:hypothetical protein
MEDDANQDYFQSFVTGGKQDQELLFGMNMLL